MAAKKDFEARFFDQLEESFNDLRRDTREIRTELRANTRTTEEGFSKINGRVRKLEEAVPIKSRADTTEKRADTRVEDTSSDRTNKLLLGTIVAIVTALIGALVTRT